MKIADNISWKKLQDKVVAVDVTTGNYYTMNNVASLIWTMLSEEKTVDEVLDNLKATFADVEESTLKADLDEQIAYWQAEKLLVD